MKSGAGNLDEQGYIGFPAKQYAVNLLWTASLLLPVFILFQFWGNRSNVAMETGSLFIWIGKQWLSEGGDFSHGWIMPLISLGVVWHNRQRLKDSVGAPSYIGLAILIISLALHWAALRAQQPRVSLVALVGVIWSIPFFIYGRKTAAELLFPVGYLLLCFTSYLLVTFTMPLRLVSGAISCTLLNGLGIHAVRHGTAIYTAAAGGFNFDVADPCSGLRSLVVMTALAAPYAYFTQKTLWKRWFLFLMAAPLAMIANVTRITTIAAVANLAGKDFAMSIYHDYSGYLVFTAATLMMLGLGRMLNGQPGLREKPAEVKS